MPDPMPAPRPTPVPAVPATSALILALGMAALGLLIGRPSAPPPPPTPAPAPAPVVAPAAYDLSGRLTLAPVPPAPGPVPDPVPPPAPSPSPPTPPAPSGYAGPLVATYAVDPATEGPAQAALRTSPTLRSGLVALGVTRFETCQAGDPIATRDRIDAFRAKAGLPLFVAWNPADGKVHVLLANPSEAQAIEAVKAVRAGK